MPSQQYTAFSIECNLLYFSAAELIVVFLPAVASFPVHVEGNKATLACEWPSSTTQICEMTTHRAGNNKHTSHSSQCPSPGSWCTWAGAWSVSTGGHSLPPASLLLLLLPLAVGELETLCVEGGGGHVLDKSWRNFTNNYMDPTCSINIAAQWNPCIADTLGPT